jgi:hypothetical protein
MPRFTDLDPVRQCTQGVVVFGDDQAGFQQAIEGFRQGASHDGSGFAETDSDQTAAASTVELLADSICLPSYGGVRGCFPEGAAKNLLDNSLRGKAQAFSIPLWAIVTVIFVLSGDSL